MPKEKKSHKKLKIIVRYSRDDMDSWDEGTELTFTINSYKTMDADNLSDLVSGYLKAVGVQYREYMFKSEVENIC